MRVTVLQQSKVSEFHIPGTPTDNVRRPTRVEPWRQDPCEETGAMPRRQCQTSASILCNRCEVEKEANATFHP